MGYFFFSSSKQQAEPSQQPEPEPSSKPPASTKPTASTDKTTHPIPQQQQQNSNNQQQQQFSYSSRHNLIQHILSTECFYSQLGIDRSSILSSASNNDNNNDKVTSNIRRAYLLRSRIIHPDRNHDILPEATAAFQRLSTAYQTLINPKSRSAYELYGHSHFNNSANHFTDHPDDAFGDALNQVFNEFLDGNFDNILRIVDHFARLNPDLIQFSPEKATAILDQTRKVVLLMQGSWSVVKFEILTLYALQQELRGLSYFDVFGRVQKSIQMTRVFLNIPLVMNTQGGGSNSDGVKQSGSSNSFYKSLSLLISLLEVGERGIGKVGHWCGGWFFNIQNLLTASPSNSI